MRSGVALAQILAKSADPLAFLDRLTFSIGLLSDASTEALGQLEDAPALSTPGVAGPLDWLLDKITTEIDRARAACNADDWVRACGDVNAVVSLVIRLQTVFGKSSSIDLAHRAMLGLMEEIRADGIPGLPLLSAHHLPPSLRFEQTAEVWSAYQSTYGSIWLEKLQSDRLLLPTALGETVRDWMTSGRYGRSGLALAAKWRSFGVQFALAFESLFGYRPFFVRSKLFNPQAFIAAFRAAHRGESNLDFDRIIDLYLFPERVRFEVEREAEMQALNVTVQIPMIVDFGEGGGWALAGVGDGSEPQSVNS